MALWSLGTLPFLTRLFWGRTSRDLEHYLLSANALLDGQRIYVDVPFEYPPYALAWLAGPATLAGDVGQYRLFFGLLILCLDALVKAALLWTGFRDRHRPPDVLPFVMYTLATAAVGHFLLQRYDVIPAALSVAAVMALSAGWAGVAGLMAALAVGTKVYPAVFVPVLAVLAWRRSQRDAKRFAIGMVAGSAAAHRLVVVSAVVEFRDGSYPAWPGSRIAVGIGDLAVSLRRRARDVGTGEQRLV